MIVVGLTGGIGSGKSTVASLLARRGAVIVDADAIARQVVEPDGAAYLPIIELFGPGVVQPDGRLDRAAIAAQVFSEPAALAALNAVTHPAIAAVMAGRIAEEGESDHVVVLDIPLLTDRARSAYGLAGVIVVDAPVDLAVDRLVQQRGFTEADARARMAAQPSQDQRHQLADVIVDNSGSLADLDLEVDALWHWLVTIAPASTATGGAESGSATPS